MAGLSADDAALGRRVGDDARAAGVHVNEDAVQMRVLAQGPVAGAPPGFLGGGAKWSAHFRCERLAGEGGRASCGSLGGGGLHWRVGRCVIHARPTRFPPFPCDSPRCPAPRAPPRGPPRSPLAPQHL
jgi:hypothetical protein